MDSKRRWLAPFFAGLLMLLGASTAQAAESVYPTSTPQRTFDSGLAGWSSDKSSEGLCVPVLLCPVITNSYQPTGGAVNNGGFIRTSLGSLTGVGATSSGLFTSPAFKYTGVGGKQPDSLSFKLARRSNVAALLSVTGNDATYSVKLINMSGHANVVVLEDQPLEGANGWADIPSVSVDPTQVKIGDLYRVRIISRFVSGVQILPGGSADYDRVRLIARGDSTGSSGSKGGGGSGGGGDSFFGKGGGKATITAVKRRGDDQLRLTVHCASKPDYRCKARTAALLRRGGSQVTSNRSVRVRPGEKRRVSVDIKTRYQDEVASRKRIVIKQRSKLRGDKHAKTTYKKLRIRNG